MAGLLDFLNNGGPSGGLLDGLPAWLTQGQDQGQWPTQPSQGGGAPDWFAQLKRRLDGGQGLVTMPGQFPQMRNPPGVPNTAMPGPQGGDSPMLPPNAQPAMQPPQQAPQAPQPQMQPGQMPPSFQPGPPMVQGGMGERALGALGGFTNARGFLPAITNAITTMATGRVTDPHELDRAQKDQSRNVTYQALLSKGVPDIEARAAMGSPDVLKQLLRQHFSPKESQFHVVGYDADGKARYGWVGSKPGEVTPYDVPRSKVAAGDGAAAGNPMDEAIFQATGDDFFGALNQIDPARASLMKKIATGEVPFPSPTFMRSERGMKLMEDLAHYEPGTDATKFRQRQTYRNQLASGSPASIGGQRNLMGTSLGHLAEAADAAAALGNYDLGSSDLSHAANFLTSRSTTQQGKVLNLQEKVDRLAGEVGKLYSGSAGGGVHEREATRNRLSPSMSGIELAGGLQAARDLLHSKLYALEQQRDEILGPQAHTVEFLGKDQKAALTKIDESIAKLKGGKGEKSGGPAKAPQRRQNGHVYEQQPDGSWKAVE